MEFTLLFAVLTGVALAWLGLRLLPTPDRPERPLDLLIGSAAMGLVAGRVAAMIQAGINPLTNPADLIIVRAGVDTVFAALGALAALIWPLRHQLPAALDALAPAALAGLAGWHAGCLWRATCLGTVSDLPWAFGQPASPVTRHPTELYAALALALGAVVVARLPSRPWLASGAALALASGVRLLTEPLRPSLSGGPVPWYLTGLVAGLAVVAFAVLRVRRSRIGSASVSGR